MSSLLIKFPLATYVPGMGCRPETSLLCLNGKLTTGDRRLGQNRGFPTAGYLHPPHLNSVNRMEYLGMSVLSGPTVKVKVNSLAPVEAVYSPGPGSAIGVGAGSGDSDASGASGADASGGGVLITVGAGSSGASDGAVGAHPANIILTTITTISKDTINFFSLTSYVPRADDEDGKISP